MIKEHMITPYSLLFNLIRKADLPGSVGVQRPAEMPRSGNEVRAVAYADKLTCMQNLPVCKWNIRFDQDIII